jgi:hypothetical protein
MAVLTLDYRCCNRKLPLYIKHVEVERIAALARQQLSVDGIDAVPFDVLRQISGLKINGIDFALEVSTDHPVHDEHGNPVFGICEFDPAVRDTAMVSVSPVDESLSELLVLSTFAHELGHAVFDAPHWIFEGSKGPGLFDDTEAAPLRAYRTTTPNGEHLAKSLPSTAEHFAELRANEFMGSLLVPRQRINAAIEELAPKYGVTIHRHPSTDPDHPGTAMRLTADGDIGFFDMECLEKALATRFGVNRRFIQVRLNRYGLTGQEAAMR